MSMENNSPPKINEHPHGRNHNQTTDIRVDLNMGGNG